MPGITPAQSKVLETIERVASCFSVLGTVFIFVTFVSSPNFRRPINRLVFYASWGNLICNVATLMSVTPPRVGPHSHLCQFQAFLIQMFVPADALWNLAMALNVYLTLFRKFNAQQLKAMEWKYHLMCYGAPFVTAFALLFAESQKRGKVYGDAKLWCWISKDWDFLRVVLCYAPAWVCIIASFAIYLMAGREIFKKRQQLRAFNNASEAVESSLSNYKTTNVEITTSEVGYPFPMDTLNGGYMPGGQGRDSRTGKSSESGRATSQYSRSPSRKPYEPYTVNIASSPLGQPRPHLTVGGSQGTAVAAQHRRNRAALEANRAAWGYTKVAILFFVSLLVTWVPSSVNRVYALANPQSSNIALAYVAGLVLSLMGFWNSVIYIVTSRAACKELFYSIASYFPLWGSSRRSTSPHDRRHRHRRSPSANTIASFGGISNQGPDSRGVSPRPGTGLGMHKHGSQLLMGRDSSEEYGGDGGSSSSGEAGTGSPSDISITIEAPATAADTEKVSAEMSRYDPAAKSTLPLPPRPASQQRRVSWGDKWEPLDDLERGRH